MKGLYDYLWTCPDLDSEFTWYKIGLAMTELEQACIDCNGKGFVYSNNEALEAEVQRCGECLVFDSDSIAKEVEGKL